MIEDEDKADNDEDEDDDEGDVPEEFPRPGATLDEGRIVLEWHVRQRLWTGWRGQRRVLITHRQMNYATHGAVIDEWYRFDAPGIASLEFLGFPDDGGPEVAVVETCPEGTPVSELGPLTTAEVVRCGLDLCDAVIAWSERRAWLTAGLRPETIYIHQGRYTAATPRIALFAGYADDDATFGRDCYGAPAANAPLEIDIDDAGFIVAQILWFTLLREHPYQLADAPDERQNIWNDRRRPFRGPPELGRIFEAVLVADPARRLGARAFRDQLAHLARTV